MKKEVRNPELKNSRYKNAEQSPGFLFWKTFFSWQRHMRLKLDEIGITQVQYSIMATASYLNSKGEDVSQQDVANTLSMDKMMVSDVIKTLEKKSFITREKSSVDARAFVLKLTPQAKKILEKATPLVESVDEEFFGNLTKAERSGFIASLSRLPH